jgi:hypothetical protein
VFKQKNIILALAAFFLSVFFFQLNVFACACCADEGFYKIRVTKPTDYELGEMRKFGFHDARVYATAAFPDNIRGIDPVSERYSVRASIGTGDVWKFDLATDDGKSGTLELKAPKEMVDFAVDRREGETGGAGSVVLYKEWRFKFKVADGSGIFADGLKSKAEYFLVLQGKGNACTSAQDFYGWRLEVAGRNADFALFGKLSVNEFRAVQMHSDRIGSSIASFKPDLTADSAANFLKIGNLTGENYYGCSCSGKTKEEAKKQNGRLFFFSAFAADGEKETAIFNIDGKDTEFKLINKGMRPFVKKVGDKFSDEYINGDTKIILDYTVKKLPCETCEGTDYDIIATIIGEYEGEVISLVGSCGC